MARERPIYPGTPILIALYIVEAFETFEDSTNGGPWPEALKSSKIPGSSASVNAALDLLRNLRAGRKQLAIDMAQRYWKVVTNNKSYKDVYEEGRKQDEKYLPELLKREDWWGVKKQKSNHKQEVT